MRRHPATWEWARATPSSATLTSGCRAEPVSDLDHHPRLHGRRHGPDHPRPRRITNSGPCNRRPHHQRVDRMMLGTDATRTDLVPSSSERCRAIVAPVADHSVVVSEHGGPEALHLVSGEVPEPQPGERAGEGPDGGGLGLRSHRPAMGLTCLGAQTRLYVGKDVDPSDRADVRGQALGYAVRSWTLVVAGVLLVAETLRVVALGLVGGGIDAFLRGRGLLTDGVAVPGCRIGFAGQRALRVRLPRRSGARWSRHDLAAAVELP